MKGQVRKVREKVKHVETLREAHATMPPPANAYCTVRPGFLLHTRHNTASFLWKINVLTTFAPHFHESVTRKS